MPEADPEKHKAPQGHGRAQQSAKPRLDSCPAEGHRTEGTQIPRAGWKAKAKEGPSVRWREAPWCEGLGGTGTIPRGGQVAWWWPQNKGKKRKGEKKVSFYGNLSILILKILILKVGSEPQGCKVEVAEE